MVKPEVVVSAVSATEVHTKNGYTSGTCPPQSHSHAGQKNTLALSGNNPEGKSLGPAKMTSDVSPVECSGRQTSS